MARYFKQLVQEFKPEWSRKYPFWSDVVFELRDCWYKEVRVNFRLNRFGKNYGLIMLIEFKHKIGCKEVEQDDERFNFSSEVSDNILRQIRKSVNEIVADADISQVGFSEILFTFKEKEKNIENLKDILDLTVDFVT